MTVVLHFGTRQVLLRPGTMLITTLLPVQVVVVYHTAVPQVTFAIERESVSVSSYQ